METLITVSGPPGQISTYSLKDLRMMAKQQVGKKGKVFAITISFDETHSATRLFASYETAPNCQTYDAIRL